MVGGGGEIWKEDYVEVCWRNVGVDGKKCDK